MKTQADIVVEKSGITGLSEAEVIHSRMLHGRNEVIAGSNYNLQILTGILKDPMVILLIVAATIYFASGFTRDAILMVSAIFIVTGISFFQESRSRKTLQRLRALTKPLCRVVRSGMILTIVKEDIVVDDFMIIGEGASVPADGIIVQCNDFTVNESNVTGESLPVEKDSNDNNKVFQGSSAASGLAICKVTAIGTETVLGKTGKLLETITKEDTPLQKQIRSFVIRMAVAGVVIFIIVWGINFFNSRDLLASLLKSLTLAMSILPEEIPVAFATFMALGAWRLMNNGVVVKNISTVEALGSASVICLDKTGTITENRMMLSKIFSLATGAIYEADNPQSLDVLAASMWASEPIPFDAMELAIHDAYSKFSPSDERGNYQMVHEYPLGGRPPMMTHCFRNSLGQNIIAAKGAPEALMNVSDITPEERQNILSALHKFAGEGYRVLGVGISDFNGENFPEEQQQFTFHFLGLIAFYDPPKANIENVLNAFYQAGILVKIITGDNAETTSTIARQIKFKGHEKAINGDELMLLSDEVLEKKVTEYNIFTRMFPEAKLRIVNALKANGHIVAMTGDGVNDGPALKAAHISIAMGKRGSEIASDASSIVLSDDNLAKMVDAIATGRKIYENLKKAVRYIVSIHIPIILTVFVPLIMGWKYPSIFTPVHIIFLELIMGPTCSIIYENEPLERNVMNEKPRKATSTFFSWQELSISVVQGLAITLGALFVYHYSIHNYNNEAITRTMVFTVLIAANIFLTLIDRSLYFSLITTLRYKNNLVLAIIIITALMTACFIFITPLAAIFQFTSLNLSQLAISVAIGFVSVGWFEIVKVYNRRKH